MGELIGPVHRLYLDTNVFIMLSEDVGETSRLLYEMLVSHRPEEQPFFCTSELTLAELLVKPLRTGEEELIRRYNEWLADSDWMAVMPVSRDVLYRAAVLRSHHRSMRLPDAIHLSTAIGISCSHFLTADKRMPDRIELPNSAYQTIRDSAELTVVAITPENVETIIRQHQS